MKIKSTVLDFLKLDELKTNVFNLVESKVELKKLEIYGEIEKKVSPIAYQLLMAALTFTIFIFVNLLIAVLINHFSGLFWLGYVCLVAFYGILLLVLHWRRDPVNEWIRSKVAKFMMRND